MNRGKILQQNCECLFERQTKNLERHSDIKWGEDYNRIERVLFERQIKNLERSGDIERGDTLALCLS